MPLILSAPKYPQINRIRLSRINISTGAKRITLGWNAEDDEGTSLAGGPGSGVEHFIDIEGGAQEFTDNYPVASTTAAYNLLKARLELVYGPMTLTLDPNDP